MLIAGLQVDLVWEDREANYARLQPRIAAAASCGARLVVLPEMFPCGFSMDVDRIAEPFDGPSVQFLAATARQHGIWIAGSLPERVGDDMPSNTLVLASPTGALQRYRKLHPFTFAREHHHYRAGTERVTTTIEGLRCTWFICYDLRFADEFWATTDDTDCYVVVANWTQKRRHHWSTLLAARAIENQAYVVGINRVGRGGGLEYTGDSAILDPWGTPLARASGAETMLLADVTPEVVADARRVFPVLNDRRHS